MEEARQDKSSLTWGWFQANAEKALTQWTWVWANSGREWRTGKPGMLQSMGLQRADHNWATEQQASETWRKELGGEEPLRVPVIELSEKGSRDFLEHPPLKLLDDEVNSLKVTHLIYAFSHFCLRNRGWEGHVLWSSSLGPLGYSLLVDNCPKITVKQRSMSFRSVSEIIVEKY